jgi:hypothetical protein
MQLEIMMDINDDYLKEAAAPVIEVARFLRELADSLENIEKAGYPSGWDVLDQPHILFHDHEKKRHGFARARVSFCSVTTP